MCCLKSFRFSPVGNRESGRTLSRQGTSRVFCFLVLFFLTIRGAEDEGEN